MHTKHARDLRPGDRVHCDLGLRYVRDVTLLNYGRSGTLVVFEVEEAPDGELSVVLDSSLAVNIEGHPPPPTSAVQSGNLREYAARRGLSIPRRT